MKNVRMRCAVGKCRQNQNKTAYRNSISFYNFPKNTAQRNKWIEFCNRVDPVNTQKEKICALHFKQEDFERNLKFEMGFSNRWTLKLKPGAVPTIETSIVTNKKKAYAPNESNTQQLLELNTKNEESPQSMTKLEMYKIHNSSIMTVMNENKPQQNLAANVEYEEGPQETIKLEKYEINTYDELNIPMLTNMKASNPQQKLEIKMENEDIIQETIKLEMCEMQTCDELNNTTQQKLEIKTEDEESPQETIELGMYEIHTFNVINTTISTAMLENNPQLNLESNRANEEECPQDTIKLEKYEMRTYDGLHANTSESTHIIEDNPQQKLDVKIENESRPQQSIIQQMRESGELNTPISTNMNENVAQQNDYVVDRLIQQIKTLEGEMDSLRQENDLLRCRSAIKLKKLTRRLQHLSYKNAKLEKALRRLFTEGQIKKLKNCGKRQNFTQEDIAQSITLYTTSPKVYELLKKQNFPLPAVRTLQRWLQIYDMSSGIFVKKNILRC